MSQVNLVNLSNADIRTFLINHGNFNFTSAQQAIDDMWAGQTILLGTGEYMIKQNNQHGESDPHGKDQHAPGAKLDVGKTRVDLMMSGFHLALLETAKVTTVGAVKYTPNGWHSVPDGEQRYKDAAARHKLTGYKESFDADTGMYHDAQEIWNLLAAFQLKLERLMKENEDGLKTLD